MGRQKLYTEEETRLRHLEASRKYALSHLGYSRKWAKLNPEKKKLGDKNWYENNSDRSKKKIKEWQLLNKDKVRLYQRKYQARRRKEDIGYCLSKNLRGRIHKVLRKNKKVGSAIKDLGCTLEFLKHHLESKFTDGMTWNNYGKWEVDHIKPLSKFNLTDRSQFLEACNYKNLQPLWRIDNLNKSNKYYARLS